MHLMYESGTGRGAIEEHLLKLEKTIFNIKLCMLFFFT